MEIQIKKTVKSGNSSAVVLPRSWLNKEVRVELIKKTPEIILLEVLEIIKKHIDQKDIIGIYLAGSYARNEEDNDSDIDILIITNGTDKEMIKEGSYNILTVSKALLNQKLENDILPIGQMIKEAKPLLNANYLEQIEIKITQKNIKWYIETTEEKINLIKKILNNKPSKISDSLIYTLILRIRTLVIINNLIKNKSYSKKDFIDLIKKTSGSKNSYQSYLSVKNSSKDKYLTNLDEAEKLLNYLEKQLKTTKDLL